MQNERSIFIVDDDEDDLYLFGEAIKESGMIVDIHYATNGFQLLELLEDRKGIENALLLIDMNMPLMNGLETLERTNSDPGLKHIPAVLMSTSNSDDLKERARKTGAVHFLCKPNKYEDYILMIKEAISYFP